MNAMQSIQRRWDAIAIDQLRAEVARLAEENDALRDECARAAEDADFWNREARDMQLQLCEQTGGEPGITQAGSLVVVPMDRLRETLAAVLDYTDLRGSLISNGCEHGYKPASACPNADCDAARVHRQINALSDPT